MGVWVGFGGWGRKNVHVDCKQKQMLTGMVLHLTLQDIGGDKKNDEDVTCYIMLR